MVEVPVLLGPICIIKWGCCFFVLIVFFEDCCSIVAGIVVALIPAGFLSSDFSFLDCNLSALVGSQVHSVQKNLATSIRGLAICTNI